eukprot:CAMPEP_0114466498 /NCGR_PEP_ID=MMETSP0104-20121206/9100_1 /TAXON_ID=37642 ORGANISM="Paraphysomonas imperforata, Strain PA2" /NCGR_SAMPLE_ID=MMETSP0104 /ASSEMBLY_ACC=CAM_ASM_000202 /LENGTH=216 /DNA_ID=CAMNT_0001639859 /DNA_START=45 /DNA_END=695 /DNA_ORIENTATION=-
MTSFFIKSCFVLMVVILLLDSANCLSTSVDAGKMECFILTAAAGMPCFGSFEILSPDPEPLSITLTGPAPTHKLYHESKYRGPNALGDDQTEGSFAFDADTDGDYELCIANGNPHNNDGQPKLVAFNFRLVEGGGGDADYEYASMQSELLDLHRGLIFLKDHQSFMNQREHVHKSTLESINFKVQCWTVLESIILIAVSFWQIGNLSTFFETKRKM